MTAAVIERGAVLSDDGAYRYSLTRWWSAAGVVRWIMLNPSTADAEVDDPTIRRCIGFARAWGYGSIQVVNLFALRATDPRELTRHPDPVGPDNDLWLIGRDQLTVPTITVCAWGAHPMAARRVDAVLELLGRYRQIPHVLGLTKDNQPRHPLYLPDRLPP